MRIAVIADIHGNVLALDAVLADLHARGGADRLVNLGDCVSGPLWPAETMARLETLEALTVRGNHDRWVSEGDPATMYPSDRLAHDELTSAQRRWLSALPMTRRIGESVLACHATPSDDDTYLIENVQNGALARGRVDEIKRRLGNLEATRIVLCGHSHRADMVQLEGGPLIINPGSVGCPAYEDPTAPAHVSESGSPMARYAIVELRGDDQVDVTFRAIPYAYGKAAKRAHELGRPQWASALQTGFV